MSFWKTVSDTVDQIGGQGGVIDSLGGAVSRYKGYFDPADPEETREAAQATPTGLLAASLVPFALIISGGLITYGLINAFLGGKKRK